MLLLLTASLAALGEVAKIGHTVEVSPNKAKNKAFRMTEGSAACDLYLTPKSPWTIRDSKIVESDDRTLWKRLNKAHYFILPYDFGGHEYVKIEGDLYKQGNGKGPGKPDLPWFSVTVPKVDLQWDEKHGDAAKEEKEDETPAILVVTESKNVFGKLIIKAPKDDFSLVERRVTLTWSNPGAVKVLDGEREVKSGVAYVFKPNGKTEKILDVCAVNPGEVKFTLEGEPDVVNKDRAVDYVKATCVALDFTVKSDAEMSYDKCKKDDGTLIDSRYATIEVTTNPKGVDVSGLGITFSAVAEEKKNLVNHDNKFDIVIEHKAGNLWKTKDKVLWYGVKPDRECWFCSNAYVFALKCHGDEVVAKKYKMRWPETNACAFWRPDVENKTTYSDAKYYPAGDYYYCQIEFKEYEKDNDGEVWTVPKLPGRPFCWTGQYADEARAEEDFHIKQLRGDVPLDQGGQGDCYTVKGLKYAIEQQAKTNSNIFTSSWVVKGKTKNMAEKNAENVIICAIKYELTMSERTIKQNRGFRELKAKESEKVRYNAAWRYHCTYRLKYGDNPKHVIHPAY